MGIREDLCGTILQMKGSPQPSESENPTALITGSGVKVGSSGGVHFQTRPWPLRGGFVEGSGREGRGV